MRENPLPNFDLTGGRDGNSRGNILPLVLAGILICSAMLLPIQFKVCSIISLLILMIIYRDLAPPRFLTALFFAALLIIIRYNQILPNVTENAAFYEHESRLEGLVEQVDVNRHSIQVVLSKVILNNSEAEVTWKGKLVVSLPSYTDISYGDRVGMRAKIHSLESIEDEGYRQHLQHQLITGVVKWPELLFLQSGQGNPFVAFGINIQQSINRLVNKLLPGDESAFLTGVVLGSRQQLSEKFENALTKTGTTHLIVASGYNISIIIGIVIKTTKRQKKIIAYLLLITFICCYVLISGLDASIIRAATMALLAHTATMLGRQKEAFYMLVMASIAMLIINPFWLFNVSFQLSVMATLGIILIQPFLERALPLSPSWLKEAISTTLAAQIMVFPVIAVTFGSLSIISLVTNTLTAWIIPGIMLGGGLLIASAAASPLLAHAVSMLLHPVLWYVKQVILLTADIPFASVNIKIGWGQAVSFYLFIGAILFIMHNRGRGIEIA